jgi:poly(beta-D-mannuronate) lyase
LELDNRLVAGNGPRAEVGSCLWRHLDAWASKGALLDNIEQNTPGGQRQAVLNIAWLGMGLANAFSLAQAATPPDPAVRQRVQEWFKQLREAVILNFTPPPQREPKLRWLDQVANHSHWAAACVGMLSATDNDLAGLNWARNELRRALATVADDGGLPPELARGAKALHYQNFAMLPLAVLVRLADANNMPLSASEAAALDRAVYFTLNANEDTAKIEALTGKTQELSSDMVDWAEILRGHYQSSTSLNTRLNAAVAKRRPIISRHLLVNVTATFGMKRVTKRTDE